ncbi:5-formyltetrahydrofolate cyclo-ligase [Endozoicomonas sp. G2_1]|uniref:5-formyltetrahydrofolate cyclo-ligase n=1 Tax=Endozoicomonas sp. G2_1 TaxID=2821091 RepID=UPI001ADCBC6C|nr:5-formyltetrahydrofolate cyclo-ligase [Endozoicomonas sp. G2_1]MBO9489000.1 5-formyltetrahydrofolate cyclo-ligase [Endozoicomonas sp. G2_1]
MPQNYLSESSHKSNRQIDRKSLRAEIKLRRESLSTLQQQQAEQQLVKKLSQHSAVTEAKHIAIYLSHKGELQTQAFIQWCLQHQKHIYLPVIHPFCPGHLLFLRYNQDTEMVANHYGILEPKLKVKNVKPLPELDLILTPLVAFDDKGNRLGMGGGFYDRTLAACEQLPQAPKVIGLAHDCQQVESIPTESWDIPLSEIITPSQRFICN